MLEETTAPQPKFIPFNTEPEVLAKILEINENNRELWENRSTEQYAEPIVRGGKYYLPIMSGYEKEFTEEEIARGVEVLPDPDPDTLDAEFSEVE